MAPKGCCLDISTKVIILKKWLTECSFWKMNLDFLFKNSIMTFSLCFLRKLWKRREWGLTISKFGADLSCVREQLAWGGMPSCLCLGMQEKHKGRWKIPYLWTLGQKYDSILIFLQFLSFIPSPSWNTLFLWLPGFLSLFFPQSPWLAHPFPLQSPFPLLIFLHWCWS